MLRILKVNIHELLTVKHLIANQFAIEGSHITELVSVEHVKAVDLYKKTVL